MNYFSATLGKADSCDVIAALPALPVPADPGQLPGDGGALAAPQTPHDGGRGQSCPPGCVPFGLFSQRGGGASHDAPGSGGRDLRETSVTGN